MLKTLKIENFAIIDEATLHFKSGFSVITGETGSGKSLVLDAIAMVFGAKVSAKDVIRQGQERANIELLIDISAELASKAAFQRILNQAGIDFDVPENKKDTTELLLSREFTTKGSRSRIQGLPVAREIVEQLRSHLLDLHGQHELTNLFECDCQRDYLDSLGDEAFDNLKRDVAQTFQRYQQVKQQIDAIQKQQQDWLQQRDFLQFQCQELEEAELSEADEDEQLKEKRDKLSYLDKIEKNIEASKYIVASDSTLLQEIESLQANLSAIEAYDPSLSPLMEATDGIYEQVRQLSSDLRRYSQGLELDPEELDSILARLDTLERLKRKYGPTLQDVFNTHASLQCKLQNLINIEGDLDAMLLAKEHLEKQLKNSADELTKTRKLLATKLEKQLKEELKVLALPAVRFEVGFEKTVFSANGHDHITFLFSANPGEPLRPLAKVASGGELSRVLLALKVVTASKEGVPTLIFDEIDTGMSGAAAKSVAEKLYRLSRFVQVFAITHQPVIAAMADYHWQVVKRLKTKTVQVQIAELQSETERVEALSKMIDGTNKAQKVAIELRKDRLASKKVRL